jgi:hypothetical protein
VSSPSARATAKSLDALALVVGVAALVAPALHTLTDVLEWYQRGFTEVQLWLNYVAFLPMPWLLLGVCAVHEPKPGAPGLIGALLYGAAFTYFAHTTLYALSERLPGYDVLWERLGSLYTAHGALMFVGGALFAWSVLRANWLPRPSVLLFLAGLVLSLVLALLPAPDIFQTIASDGLCHPLQASVSGGPPACSSRVSRKQSVARDNRAEVRSRDENEKGMRR